MGDTEYGEAPGDQTGGDPPLNDPRRPAEQSIADDDDPGHGEHHYLVEWAIAKGLRPPIERPRRPPLAVVRPGAEPDRLRRYALATLDSCATEVAGTPEGGRNHTLNAATYRAARVALAAGLELAIVRAAMEDAGTRSGLGAAETCATVASGLGGAEQAGPADLSHVGESYGDAYSFDPDDGRHGPSPFARGGSFILDVPAVPPSLWGEGKDVLWMAGESLMIAGPMGLGKTTLAGLLIRGQLGLGGELLGLPVSPREGKILYLAMDRPQQIARAMRRQFCEADRAVLDERLLIWQGPPPADVAKHPETLTLAAERAGASTLYVDSVKDAAIGLSEDEVGAGYNRARQLLLRSGCELCELHHTTKRGANGGPPTTAADVYGSAWIANGTGSIVMLSGDPGDPIVGFRHIRQPASEVGPFQLLHDQDAGQVTVHHATDLLGLVAASGADGLTAHDAAVALFEPEGSPTRGQVEKARRKLDKLTDAGLLDRVEGVKGGGEKQPTAWFPANPAVTL